MVSVFFLSVSLPLRPSLIASFVSQFAPISLSASAMWTNMVQESGFSKFFSGKVVNFQGPTFDADLFWARLVSLLQAGCPIGCGTSATTLEELL